MDPYITVEYGNIKKKTKTKSQAGKFPIWNESFEFNIGPQSEQVKVCCMDSDLLKRDDLVRKTYFTNLNRLGLLL